jgi:hypothetical protein
LSPRFAEHGDGRLDPAFQPDADPCNWSRYVAKTTKIREEPFLVGRHSESFEEMPGEEQEHQTWLDDRVDCFEPVLGQRPYLEIDA